MKRILTLIFIFAFLGFGGQLYSDELHRGMAESADDGQQVYSDAGYVDIGFTYIELMLNWFIDRWGGAQRFPNVTIPQGATINSAYIWVRAYSASWLYAHDSIACHDVDSATVLEAGAGTYDISERWANRTEAFVLWDETMSSANDSTPDLKTLIQEIVDRPGWESGNALMVLYRNLPEGVDDSAAYEIWSWDVDAPNHAYGGTLRVDYTPAAEAGKKIMWRK